MERQVENAPHHDARPRAHGLWLKWLYIAAVAPSLASRLVYDSPQVVAWADLSATAIAPIIGLVWLGLAWESVPRGDVHYTKLGGISPLGAVLRMLIPVFGLYWAFEAHLVLCGAMNDSLTRRQVPTRATALPAMGAMTAHVVLFVVLVAKRALAPGVVFLWIEDALWLVYMVSADTARRIMVLAWGAEREALSGGKPALR